MHLPRMELPRRNRQIEEIAKWKKEKLCALKENVSPNKPNPMAQEHIRLLQDASRIYSEMACAIYDGSPFTLQPGEAALVPAAWAGGQGCLAGVPPAREDSCGGGLELLMFHATGVREEYISGPRSVFRR